MGSHQALDQVKLKTAALGADVVSQPRCAERLLRVECRHCERGKEPIEIQSNY